MPLLEVSDLHIAYGALEVVKGVSFAIEPGEIVLMLGSNGAGKTTTMRSLAGLLPPARGRIAFAGVDTSRSPPHAIANLGLALVPEGRQLFPEHTVQENLELGAYRHLRRGRRAEFARRRCTSCFRACASASASRPACSAAASSRWSRSP